MLGKGGGKRRCARDAEKVIKLAPHKDVLMALSLRVNIKSLRCHAFPRELLKKSWFLHSVEKMHNGRISRALAPSFREIQTGHFTQFITKSRVVGSKYERSSYIIIISLLLELCTRYKDKNVKKKIFSLLILKNFYIYLSFLCQNIRTLY